ncbi:RimK family alpha-L-glutamate ligase [Sporosarcina pasteurii]|uniref:Alpha-aminoadipate--lysW ligase lysX n=1 Tax=Sporosarcina pasteurii TaxID=1474 RepID=A0A380BXW6_SPOPA|nr:ATP-grasp domain-containing protein [Sporosarcina pasteurii]MDS9471344.1 ATP-grasp domain-containing protein [Sporosarcina pasteurii]QBQ05028.1 ATP-grasp domain-containing protein [Sporosarcina pasteurii]SUJ07885.1 Alpha-aminoadipate--lysW ligase lysX [Sporosarcina pasteurii]
MKGYLYYEREDAQRNEKFIDELLVEAKKCRIDLQLIVDDERPDEDARFVIFRGRDYRLAQKFEADGLRVFNRSEVSRIANNKLGTFELAIMLGIPTIETHKLYTPKQIEKYPVVVKTADGYGGQEVHLCKEEIDVVKVQEKYADRLLVVQPYIETNATDVRIFVLGEEILGAVKRSGVDSFKSNYTLGGKVEKYKPSKRDQLMVEKITSALHSDYIGIDFLVLPNGQLVLNEIEDPVGARSLYGTHDFSVAEKLMAYIADSLTK